MKLIEQVERLIMDKGLNIETNQGGVHPLKSYSKFTRPDTIFYYDEYTDEIYYYDEDYDDWFLAED